MAPPHIRGKGDTVLFAHPHPPPPLPTWLQLAPGLAPQLSIASDTPGWLTDQIIDASMGPEIFGTGSERVKGVSIQQRMTSVSQQGRMQGAKLH